MKWGNLDKILNISSKLNYEQSKRLLKNYINEIEMTTVKPIVLSPHEIGNNLGLQ